MSEMTPPPRRPEATLATANDLLEPVLAEIAFPAKSIFRSKTFWLQVVALLSMVSPQVRAFVSANPVEAAALLGAANTILRFATSGRVTLFSPAEVDAAERESSGRGTSPRRIWMLLLLVAMAGLAAFGRALPGLVG